MEVERRVGVKEDGGIKQREIRKMRGRYCREDCGREKRGRQGRWR
jgi:hypothetical protein